MDQEETIKIGHNPEEGSSPSQEQKESDQKVDSDNLIQMQETLQMQKDGQAVTAEEEQKIGIDKNDMEEGEPESKFKEQEADQDLKEEIGSQKESSGKNQQLSQVLEEEKADQANQQEQLKSLESPKEAKAEQEANILQEQETAPITQQEEQIVSPEARIQLQENNMDSQLLPDQNTQVEEQILPKASGVEKQISEKQPSQSAPPEPQVEDLDLQEQQPASQQVSQPPSQMEQREIPKKQKANSAALQPEKKMHRKGVSQIPQSHLSTKAPSKAASSKQRSSGVNTSMQESSSTNYRHKLNQLMERKDAGEKLKKEFLLQKYKNTHFEERKEMSAERKQRIDRVHSSQVRISHERDNSDYMKFGKKDVHSTRRTSFSNGRREVWWNQYYSSLNGSEACQSSFRQADTPLRAERPLIPQTRLGVAKKVEQMKSSYQNSPYITKGPEPIQRSHQMNSRAAQVYQSKIFFGMGN